MSAKRERLHEVTKMKTNSLPTVAYWIKSAIVIGLLVVCLQTAPSQEPTRQLVQNTATQKRIALVIGNGAYTSAPPLKNPPNDARDMAATLRALGFDVTNGINVSQRDMKRLIREFGQKLRAGGSGLFFYAGHGVQSSGRNYLIPVDADIQSEAEVEDSSVDVSLVLNYMDDAQNGLNIVILDACRNNPFARSFRSASDGLAQVDAPTGTLIAYATAPGRVASDGTGQNGLYTSELLKQMKVPGVSVTDMFMRVRAEVMKQTASKQVPWEASSLVGSFYFTAPKSAGTLSHPATESKVDSAAFELSYWETIRNSSDPDDFKDYLSKYPGGQFVGLAQRRIVVLANAGKNRPEKTASKITSAPDVKQPASSEAGTATNSTGVGAKPPNPLAPLRSFDFLTVTLTSSGSVKSRDRKMAYAYLEDLGGGVKLEMVAIPPGEFMMGSSDADVQRAYQDAKRYDDKAEMRWFTRETPQHRVRINYWFYAGKFEVTQAQWRAVMGNNPSKFKDCDECPVEQVSWNDAVDFCRKLSARTGREYRLPSEAEWEYAARAGGTMPFAFGDTLTPEIVNYDGNYPYANTTKGTYRQKTVTAGSLGVANGFGLYDMHGNVWEWCQDWYHESYAAVADDAPTDGSAWLSGGEQKYRVLRGGSWRNDATSLRSANRLRLAPDNRVGNYGFRVVAVR